MKCEIIQDLLPLYVDDICSSETKEEVEKHLQTCEECRRRETELRAEFILEVKEPEELDKKEALKKREKAVMTTVNERLLRVGAAIDIVLTITLLTTIFYLCIEAKGIAAGIRTALMSFPDSVPLGGILLILLGYDSMYLINEKRGKDTFVSGSIILLSIGAKVICLLILFIYLICKMAVS